MLIFNSTKKEYQALHEHMIKYFHFLSKKSQKGLKPKEIDAWFNFSEVPNNWLGYSLVGNKGLALGKKYAKFLYDNIEFMLNTNEITHSPHIEKTMLLYEGSGRDKISDLTVNLIKSYLLEYSEFFAKQYLEDELCGVFPVDKAFFSYDTESFVSKEYYLPYILNDKGKKEFVLLTPFDILREGEPSINKNNFYESHQRIRESIENDTIRAFINNYISQAVSRYESDQKRNKRSIREPSIAKIEKTAFKEIVDDYPILYDYYIKLREADTEEIKMECLEELNYQLEKLLTNSKKLITIFENNAYSYVEGLTAREEARSRLKFFKHIIENCDGYRNLYAKGKRIANENDLQRLFRFVWFGTSYKVDCEPNNGRGQVDFLISKGQGNQNIIEFKLARNPTLAHVFTQVEIYEVANCSDGSLVAIFYFTNVEYISAQQVVKDAGFEDLVDKSIFLIDCRDDNKPSASIA